MIHYLLHGNVPKGEFGYISSEKKRRFLLVCILLGVPLFIFFSSWVWLGSRETIWTVIAIVGSLPACKALVSLIMMLMRKPMDRNLYTRIRQHEGSLAMAYEMYMTFYEKSAFLDAAAICGRQVVILSTDPAVDVPYMVSHMKEILQKNGYRTDIHILTNEKVYLERLDSMNENADSLRSGVQDREDDRYPGFTREEIVRALILSLCL